MINTELLYTLPEFEDPEGSSVNISIELNPQILSLVSIDNNKTVEICTNIFSIGAHQIKIILKDELNFNSSSTFSVTVYSASLVYGKSLETRYSYIELFKLYPASLRYQLYSAPFFS
jgi:hypothetical protein